MADPNTRQGKRTPVTLKIKFKSETLQQFIERYAVDVSQGGIFIRTKDPLAVGTQMKFEFQLKDASPLIAGEGTVVWTRENDPSRPAIAPGMGVRFDRLAEGSQQVLEKILAEKLKQAPSRTTGESPTKPPPMFTDVPTKVAPAPVQDALLGSGPIKARTTSEETPLPKPVPFHSDAEDFDEKAFEEATKVRAVDDLIAETAKDENTNTAVTAVKPADAAEMAADELALRRHARPDTPVSEPPPPEAAPKAVPDRDSAPSLPNPPAAETGRTSRQLDTTPSPRQAPHDDDDDDVATPEPVRPAAKAMKSEPTDKVAQPRAVASEPSRPHAPSGPSSAPIVIAILVVVAAALAGVWWFVLREPAAEEAARNTPGSGSAPATHPGSAAGSALVRSGSGAGSSEVGSGSALGSAQPQVGSAGSAAKPVATVDTVITASVPNATVEIEGTDQSGPSPFTAKLEKDKPYKARVHAAGFVGKELDVKGGQAQVAAKLDAKPKVISVTSEPPGAQILLESGPTGKVTPADVDVPASVAQKPKLHITLKKAGFRPADQMVEPAAFTEEDARVVAKIDVKLAAAPVAPPGGGGATHPPGGGNTTVPAGSGSATPPAGSGAGSAATPPPPPPPPPPPGGDEPEPSFDKK